MILLLKVFEEKNIMKKENLLIFYEFAAECFFK